MQEFIVFLMNLMDQRLEEIKLLGGLFPGNGTLGLKKSSVTHASPPNICFRTDQAKTITFPGCGEKRIDSGEISYQRPAYMTDYNGCGITPDNPDYDPNLTGESAMYYPLVPWEQLTDTVSISDPFLTAARECYRLGLIRPLLNSLTVMGEDGRKQPSVCRSMTPCFSRNSI